MDYKMTDERWESIMAYIRESISHPENTPDDVLLLALSADELTQIFTPRRIELIEAITTHRPRTMSILARLLKRELPAVERDLKVLERLGVVELTKTGREVTPRIEKELIVLPLIRPLSLTQKKRAKHLA